MEDGQGYDRFGEIALKNQRFLFLLNAFNGKQVNILNVHIV